MLLHITQSHTFQKQEPIDKNQFSSNNIFGMAETLSGQFSHSNSTECNMQQSRKNKKVGKVLRLYVLIVQVINFKQKSLQAIGRRLKRSHLFQLSQSQNSKKPKNVKKNVRVKIIILHSPCS